MQQPAAWIDKLSKWLPYHEDQALIRLANAINGSFTPSFVDSGDEFKGRISKLESRSAPLMKRLKSKMGR
jgi:hypothetical protein